MHFDITRPTPSQQERDLLLSELTQAQQQLAALGLERQQLEGAITMLKAQVM